jgi:tryptophan synthase alpha chain
MEDGFFYLQSSIFYNYFPFSTIYRQKMNQKIKLMTHVVIGYPSIQETEELVLLMDKVGVDFIELQIPFSDPLADGPTIMKACEASLKNGTKVADAFNLAKKLSSKVKTPLLFMAYFNIVFAYGIEKFCRDSKDAGIKGLIVPDFPLEEEGTEHFNQCLEKYDLLNIKVLSPASTEERIKMNAKVGTGFVYCTARQGITGAEKGFDSSVINYLKTVRKYFDIPIALGFGISKKEHVKQMEGLADIAVVGSAILDIMNANPNSYLNKVEGFLRDLKG